MLCPHEDPQKIMIMNHFLSMHPNNEISGQIKSQMYQIEEKSMKVEENQKINFNEYEGKVFRHLFTPEGIVFQCHLCIFEDPKKIMIFNHFLATHSDNEISEELKCLMYQKEKPKKKSVEKLVKIHDDGNFGFKVLLKTSFSFFPNCFWAN